MVTSPKLLGSRSGWILLGVLLRNIKKALGLLRLGRQDWRLIAESLQSSLEVVCASSVGGGSSAAASEASLEVVREDRVLVQEEEE